MLTHVLGLPWMPPPNTIRMCEVGRWWDAVVIPQTLGLDVLEVLDHKTGRTPGPVIWDQNPPRPRLYFLVPVGTSDAWDAAGAEALGPTTFVGVPGPTTLDPPGPHWLCPPDPDSPKSLVDAEALAAAIKTTLGSLR